MLLVLDFDETITLHAGKPDEWKVLSDAYMKDYAAAKESVSNIQPATFGQLHTYLDAFDNVERASIQRITESRFFEGVGERAIKELAESIQLRPGFTQFITSLRPYLESGLIKLHILSVNWSALLIRHTLCSQAALTPELFYIHCNDILLQSTTGIATGAMSPYGSSEPIHTATDKLRVFTKLQKSALQSVYVGDSLTDLYCLLQAKVGIFIGEKDSVLDVIQRMVLTLIPLQALASGTHKQAMPPFDLSQKTQPVWKTRTSVHVAKLYTATTWSDISSFLFHQQNDAR
ncbi:fungal protein [Schizosaccharomyces japonicus yFS275]|uniref:Fungal protein n=1 Tax=Schizosaccharomyces japonicus (strain yFS275 / FY16936) TaxID=402676 RepID=B6JVP8_SCHJY|nr:fungal protein [Schizosaccharomyces japonicus yFS275]EEB05449.1 fungal protein [Schizosaccharomyces japonicus yFS275]